MSSADTDTKPTTHNGNLAKLPRALAPLLERHAMGGLALDAGRRPLD